MAAVATARAATNKRMVQKGGGGLFRGGVKRYKRRSGSKSVFTYSSTPPRQPPDDLLALGGPMLARQPGSQSPREARRLLLCSQNLQPLPMVLLLTLMVLNSVWVTAAEVQVVPGAEGGETGMQSKRGDSMRHIELLSRRSALDKNFMRFGRAGGADNFMRFGRGNVDNMMRFGRGDSSNFMRFGRRRNDDNSSNFMRFGRGGDKDSTNFIRFGRGYDEYDDGDNFNRNIRRNDGTNFLQSTKNNEVEESADNHPLSEHEDVSTEPEYRERRAAPSTSWTDMSPDYAHHQGMHWIQRRALSAAVSSSAQ
ncbi:hypothetical protein B566_EDAN000833 [Ephemera danica]|nr:hypothetical protein B566_EDAN000833 [Ephemera danica]